MKRQQYIFMIQHPAEMQLKKTKFLDVLILSVLWDGKMTNSVDCKWGFILVKIWFWCSGSRHMMRRMWAMSMHITSITIRSPFVSKKTWMSRLCITGWLIMMTMRSKSIPSLNGWLPAVPSESLAWYSLLF